MDSTCTSKAPQHSWSRTHILFISLLLIYILVPLTLDTMSTYGMDDAFYQWSARDFAKTGQFHYSGWWASLIGQTWLAYPSAKFFGGSTGAFRILTLLLGMVCLVCVYVTALNLGCKPRASALIAAALYANPVFFLLLFTFMTDVPSLTFGLLGLAFWVCAICRGRPVLMLVGGLFTAYAILIRQNGLFWPIGLLLYVLFESKNVRRQFLPHAIAVLLLNLGTLIILPKLTGVHKAEQPVLATFSLIKPSVVFSILLTSIGYVGSAALPFLLGGIGYLIHERSRLLSRTILLCSAAALAAVCLAYVKRCPGLTEPVMPYALGHIITRCGGWRDFLPGEAPVAFALPPRALMTVLFSLAGAVAAAIALERLCVIAGSVWAGVLRSPRRLKAAQYLVLGLAAAASLLLVAGLAEQHAALKILGGGAQTASKQAKLVLFYRGLLLVMAASAAGCWLAHFRIRRLKVASDGETAGGKAPAAPQRLLYWAALIQSLGIYATRNVYDRYYIPLLPLVMILVVRKIPAEKLRVPIIAVSLAVYMVFSWGVTRDVLAWNSARDSICNRWLAAGVQAKDIEGGYYWNISHVSLPLKSFVQKPSIHNPYVWDPGWFPDHSGLHAVANQPLPGYRVESTAAYTTVFPPRIRQLYGLHWEGPLRTGAAAPR